MSIRYHLISPIVLKMPVRDFFKKLGFNQGSCLHWVLHLAQFFYFSSYVFFKILNNLSGLFWSLCKFSSHSVVRFPQKDQISGRETCGKGTTHSSGGLAPASWSHQLSAEGPSEVLLVPMLLLQLPHQAAPSGPSPPICEKEATPTLSIKWE